MENQKRRQIERVEFEKNLKRAQIENANIMRDALQYFGRGLNTWQVAEKIQRHFSSVWDAYDFLSSKKAQENARRRYAKQYVVKCLADNGFSLSEIAKIAGYSPQRCGQILKNGVF